MSESAPVYRFGAFEIDGAERVLRCAGDVVPLGGRATDTLLALLERPGRLVSKGEMLERVWPDAVVEENSLDKSISTLRKALGDSSRAPRFLETMARRGYRFVARVDTSAGRGRGARSSGASGTGGPDRTQRGDAALVDSLVQETRFRANEMTNAAFRAGLATAEAATGIDPLDAAAWETLAYHSMMGVDLFESPRSAFTRSRAAAERALAADARGGRAGGGRGRVGVG
jgi:DNA-binding winged helix-turn-helix (wHTH) protein